MGEVSKVPFVVLGIVVATFWFMSHQFRKAKRLRIEANRMQRDRNDYLAGYRTRTVNQQRAAHGFYDSFYYSVPVQKNIPCPSQRVIVLPMLHLLSLLYFPHYIYL